MAFPFVFDEDFELGTKGAFDTESDTDGVLDFPHYSELARFPGANHMPYSGAYCMRVALAGGTNDATLAEADIDIADTVTNHFAFNMLIANDFTGTANDTIPILELLGTGPATVVALGIIYTTATDVITLGCGSATTGATPSNAGTFQLKRDVWYTIEMLANIETNSTGVITVFITKAGDPAQLVADISLTSQNHIAVEDGLFGVQDQESTTVGTFLFDNFVQDDARVFPTRDQFPNEVLITADRHVFVGPGRIDNITLMSGGATNNVVTVFDTDEALTTDASNIVVELKNTANNEMVDPAGMPVHVQRGAYVVMTGTEPRALVQIGNAPMYGKSMKDYGLRR